MAGNIREYDVDKLNKIKEDIEAKEQELFNEINNALGSKDYEAYNHLKQLQLQCTAELRLIKHIEDDMQGEFMIC